MDNFEPSIRSDMTMELDELAPLNSEQADDSSDPEDEHAERLIQVSSPSAFHDIGAYHIQADTTILTPEASKPTAVASPRYTQPQNLAKPLLDHCPMFGLCATLCRYPFIIFHKIPSGWRSNQSKASVQWHFHFRSYNTADITRWIPGRFPYSRADTDIVVVSQRRYIASVDAAQFSVCNLL